MNTQDEHISFNQRKIKKSYRSVTGHFPSVKNNKSIGFESLLESFLFLALEFDDSVESYMEQPQIQIVLNGKKKMYSADCYVKRFKDSNKRNTIIEVKYVREIEEKKEYFEQKFEAARKACEALNIDFVVVTEEKYSAIYIDNLDFLYRYKTNPTIFKYDKEILEKLENNKKTAYDLAKSISNNLLEYQIVSNAIWNLVAKNVLKSDLHNEKLTMNSVVEIAS
ncbi:MAG: TnsA endonuclease N-terminal domain-containing protein [Arcobacteraceae bacterium]